MAQLKMGDTTLISDSSGTPTFQSGLIFPTGHIQQIEIVTNTGQSNFTSDTPTAVSGFNKAITVDGVISKFNKRYIEVHISKS